MVEAFPGTSMGMRVAAAGASAHPPQREGVLGGQGQKATLPGEALLGPSHTAGRPGPAARHAWAWLAAVVLRSSGKGTCPLQASVSSPAEWGQ